MENVYFKYGVYVRGRNFYQYPYSSWYLFYIHVTVHRNRFLFK